MSFVRVSRENPCLVCGRPDWCLIAEDCSAVICARVSEGSKKRCKNSGYLHILKKSKYRPKQQRRLIAKRRGRQVRRDIAEIAKRFEGNMTPKKYEAASRILGVSIESLRRLRVGANGRALSFPMRNTSGEVVGIRLRFPSGKKNCVRGSHNSLFIPDGLTGDGPLFIVEGNTDTAAALDLGFDVVGRPNCNSLVAETAQLCRDRDAVLIPDNDRPKPNGQRPGINGAKILARRLVFACPSVRIVLPPIDANDLRGWVQRGLTRGGLLLIIKHTKSLTLELTECSTKLRI